MLLTVTASYHFSFEIQYEELHTRLDSTCVKLVRRTITGKFRDRENYIIPTLRTVTTSRE
jgi:hypothetical protein